MKKIIIGLVLLVAVLFVGVNLFGAMVLGHILENAIGAPVSVGRIHLGILSSRVGLYNIKINNPKGFHEKTLTDIHEISVRYDLGAFFRGKVHLKAVRLDFGDVTVEKNATSQVNLLELGAVKGITTGIGSGDGEAKPGKPGEGKAGAQKGPKLQMDEVVVNIGKARYVDSAAEPPVVKEYDLGIHNETFKDVTNTQRLVKDISFLILRKVGLSSLTGNFDILMKGVGGGIQSTVDKLLKN
ncbi:MAG: hypothetical protein JW893_08900 [Candidatus Omnitrophica bacterium]|nr:hypothetical protein [Candidatus Omnitrophota bacterium]